MNLCPYPLDTFPELLARAIRQVASTDPARIQIAANSALAALATVCQTTARVRLPWGGESPGGLFLLTVADSVTAKSWLDQIFKKPLDDFQARLIHSHAARRFENEVEEKIWRRKVDLMVKKFASCETSAQEQELRIKFQTLRLSEPKKLAAPLLIVQDATEAGLREHFRACRTGLLTTNDAGAELGAAGANVLTSLVKLYDGQDRHVHRADRQFSILSPRLTVHYALQRANADKYLYGGGRNFLESGLGGRFLTVAPVNLFQPFNASDPSDHSAITNCLDWIGSEMEAAYSCPASEETIVEFEEAASASLLRFSGEVRAELADRGAYADVPQFAGRVAENVARLALDFCKVQGRSAIDSETVSRARELGRWYLNEHKRVFGVGAIVTELHADYRALDTWLNEFAISTGEYSISKAILERRLVPHALRKVHRLDPALTLLERNGRVRLDRQARLLVVHLNPAFYGLGASVQIAPPGSAASF